MIPRAYYNEIDAYAAQWLRNLIKQGLIADGDVDTRSIADVRPVDLKGYTQCHFFAGIGGWSYALRLADVEDRYPIWTGSCPCQPFSDAGQRRGTDDARHLWPEFYRLIALCKPAIVFGEQVASPLGRQWFSGIRADLENVEYAVGGADLCAAGIGAPHIRQRLYWMAHTHGANAGAEWKQSSGQQRQQSQNGFDIEGMGFSKASNGTGGRTTRDGRRKFTDASSTIKRMGDAAGEPARKRRQPWQYAEAAECDDGWRRIEPGAQPLAHGISHRLDKISGYGNAILPQIAKEFILASIEAIHLTRNQK